MSVICRETEQTVGIDGEGYYVASRPNSPGFTALSQEVIDRIPETERRPASVEGKDSGIDVHAACGSSLMEMSFGESSSSPCLVRRLRGISLA